MNSLLAGHLSDHLQLSALERCPPYRGFRHTESLAPDEQVKFSQNSLSVMPPLHAVVPVLREFNVPATGGLMIDYNRKFIENLKKINKMYVLRSWREMSFFVNS